jgi:hypothetical protein
VTSRQDEVPAWMRPAHAAAYLDISRSTFERHVATRTEIARRYVGRIPLYRTADLDRWMQQRAPHTPAKSVPA